MKVRFLVVVLIAVFAIGLCVYSSALEGGSKAKAVAGSVAADQSSAGVDESEVGAIKDEVTAYKGKDELREEDVVPAYPATVASEQNN